VTTRRFLALGLVLGVIAAGAVIALDPFGGEEEASSSSVDVQQGERRLASLDQRLKRLHRVSKREARQESDLPPPASRTTRSQAAGSEEAKPASDGVDSSVLSGVSVTQSPIPFGAERKQQTAAYSERHYGDSEWRLVDPKLIVLHYTAGSTTEGAIATFAANTPNLGELPGTCAHFVVGQDGTINQLVDLGIRCRHAIGVNDSAIGIELVQEATPDAIDQIFARPEQIDATLDLVASLMRRYGLGPEDVIGHGMVNDSPYFHDLQGWTNDHTDWLEADVTRFRSLLR